MRYYFYPLGVLATTSALLLPPTATAQTSDLDKGFGIQNNGSPSARAQARRQEALTPAEGAKATTNNNREDGTPTPWFLEDSVQNELGIEDPDLGPLYDDYNAVWQRYKEREARIEAAKTPEEKELEKYEELAQQSRTTYRRDVNDLLERRFSQQQQQRYNQLRRQYMGINAFDDPDYVEYFGFDTAQRTELLRLQDRYNRRLTQLRDYRGDPAERRRELDRLRQQTAADLDRMLTDEQRQAMTEMNGSPFSFSDDSFFGTAGDLDGRRRNNPNPNPNQRPTPNRANPGSGIGTPGNAAPGSGIGVPQRSAPNTGSPPSNSGGTAGDLNGGSGGGGNSGS